MKFEMCKRERFRKVREKFRFYVFYTTKSEILSATQRCFSFYDAMIILLDI